MAEPATVRPGGVVSRRRVPGHAAVGCFGWLLFLALVIAAGSVIAAVLHGLEVSP